MNGNVENVPSLAQLNPSTQYRLKLTLGEPPAHGDGIATVSVPGEETPEYVPTPLLLIPQSVASVTYRRVPTVTDEAITALISNWVIDTHRLMRSKSRASRTLAPVACKANPTVIIGLAMPFRSKDMRRTICSSAVKALDNEPLYAAARAVTAGGLRSTGTSKDNHDWRSHALMGVYPSIESSGISCRTSNTVNEHLSLGPYTVCFALDEFAKLPRMPRRPLVSVRLLFSARIQRGAVQ